MHASKHASPPAARSRTVLRGGVARRASAQRADRPLPLTAQYASYDTRVRATRLFDARRYDTTAPLPFLMRLFRVCLFIPRMPD